MLQAPQDARRQVTESSQMQPRMRVGFVLLLAGAVLVPAAVFADSWLPAEEKTYASEDGRWRLTVTPRPIGGALAYFQDKVDGLDNAGGLRDAPDHALGRMERREGRGWVEAWSGPLVNDVAPVSALVSASGHAVTFDNWHSMGHGDDAVVIYDTQGGVVRAMGLEDFLPPVYVEALPRSVSSIHWSGAHAIASDGRELVLQVVVPQEDRRVRGESPHVALRFDLATGVQVRPSGSAWEAALVAAEKVAQLQREERLQWRAQFVAPLSAPGEGSGTRDWHGYLMDAFFRLDPDWENGYPSTKVVTAQGDSDHRKSVGWLRDALADCDPGCVVMVASPSQDALVAALAETGLGLRPGALEGARVYAAVAGDHAEAARAALAHANPTWIRLDPAQPIPQRRERLEQLAAREAEEAGSLEPAASE